MPSCHDLYDALIDGIRFAARRMGYAITVHGSLERDIDLVAVPWREGCVAPAELAEGIRIVAQAINGFADMAAVEASDPYHRKGCPGLKPHGRLVWSFHLGGGPYIDLSVMPPEPVVAATPVPERSEVA